MTMSREHITIIPDKKTNQELTHVLCEEEEHHEELYCRVQD